MNLREFGTYLFRALMLNLIAELQQKLVHNLRGFVVGFILVEKEERGGGAKELDEVESSAMDV